MAQTYKNIEMITSLMTLRQRISVISGSKDVSIEIAMKLVKDLDSINWAIDELLKVHFTPILLVVGQQGSLDFNMPKIRYNDLDMIISIDPTKVEVALCRKYLIPENFDGTKLALTELPQYLICDRYWASEEKFRPECKAAYMEGYIIKDSLEEIGRRGVKQDLRKWLVNLILSLRDKRKEKAHGLQTAPENGSLS
jgi:hypothetical protein